MTTLPISRYFIPITNSSGSADIASAIFGAATLDVLGLEILGAGTAILPEVQDTVAIKSLDEIETTQAIALIQTGRFATDQDLKTSVPT